MSEEQWQDMQLRKASDEYEERHICKCGHGIYDHWGFDNHCSVEIGWGDGVLVMCECKKWSPEK